MASMHSSMTEMVEKKVLEMAQHASFHQHVSYNLSTILHAFTAGKTDPAEIAEAFSRAGGLEVITRVVSGEPLAKPTVIALCCGVARRVIDKFGPGVAESQAGRLAEAVVSRLGHGVSGDDAQTVECQVECARLLSSVAGRSASLLLSDKALGTLEDMIERLGAKHRPGSSGRSLRKRPHVHARTPSFPSPSRRPGFSPSWGWGEQRSLLRPCCEALERVSQSEAGRAAFEERGTGGILLATIRDFPDALDEGSDPALASALKVVERIFMEKSPEACALSLRAHTEEESSGDLHRPTPSDYASCVETLLAVAEATPEVPGAAAANCLWWLSGASDVAPRRALAVIMLEAAEDGGKCVDEIDQRDNLGTEKKEGDDAIDQLQSDVWSWFPRSGGEDAVSGASVSLRSQEAARFLAALCLSKPGLQSLEDEVRRACPRAVGALVKLCGSEDPVLAGACLRVVERLARAAIGEKIFLEAGALKQATEAGLRFEATEEGRLLNDSPIADEVLNVDDAHTYAIAAALGSVASLADAVGEGARPMVDDAFHLAVRCLRRIGEFSGRPAAAAAKSALDVITIRLSGSDRPKGPAASRRESSCVPSMADGDGDRTSPTKVDEASDQLASGMPNRSAIDGEVDEPMEILGDASAILTVMRAHPTDARVQQAGWKSLVAMDTGRGDVETLLAPGGNGKRSRRQMLRDALERHGGDSLVAGQVAEILEGLALLGDSDGENSVTTSMSDAHGDESPRWPNGEIHSSGDGSNDHGETPYSETARGGAVGGGGTVPEEAHPRELPNDKDDAGDGAEGGLEVSGSGVSADAVADDEPGHGGGRGVGDGGGGGDSEADGCGHNDDDGLPVERAESGDERAPEDVMVALSLREQENLGDEGMESDMFSIDGDSTDGNGSIVGTRIVRALFGKDISDGGGEEADDLDDLVATLSAEQLSLDGSWNELERLHKDVMGRSELLGGESAVRVAAMYNPEALKEKVQALLEGVEGAQSRNAVIASSLAMVDALTAATGALAASQREVQRYLQLSRDLRETSTMRDKLDAMQWTMDTLKATVILFTPHTGHLITKDLGICKNTESASKLFKEAALNIKIIVVELAGEHEPNTEWRVATEAFESLPANRKVMMLRHLRSLVVAYDHLSEESRKDLTTALEIIKNREVLNRMGKSCVEAEALEERRRQAKIRAAQKRMQGKRRPSGKHGGSNGKRSPSTGPGTPTDLRGPQDSAAKSSGGPPSSMLGSTPPGTPGSSNGSKSTPPSSRRGSLARFKTPQPLESCGDAAPLGATGTFRVRGIAYQQRRQDDAGPSPSSGPRSSVSRGRPKSPTSRGRSSKTPAPRGRRSKSPTNRRRASKSLTSRPAADDINPPPRIPHVRGKER